MDADPLSIVSGELDHRPEVAILLALVSEAAEQAGEGVLRRWARTSGPAGAPLDMLLRRDFAAFEAALGELGDRGLIIRRRER
ncbi:MAG: hypothetical protein M3P40_08825 [Actinomycetota bacterium]|nr:hypothetical protein [Actinomycetota bacterium]